LPDWAERLRPKQRGATVVGTVALAFLFFSVAAASAADLPEAVTNCLACHGQEDLSLTLEDGTELSLYVNADQFASSIHGPILVCTDCHENGYEEGHPKGVSFPSRRAYTISTYELCKKCHFDTYTRTLESAHFEAMKKGNQNVPVCADCHGAHNMQDPHEKGAMMSRSCGRCHNDVYQRYAKSVHGKALVNDGIRDVPACADCHTAHSIEHPATVSFRIGSPHICIKCHGDPKIMNRYGIPTTVATTYLADFHGVTATLANPDQVAQRQLVVTCIDCHGVHDIEAPEEIGAAGMKARVERVCERCHHGAAADFPAAWLSHYQPSLKHAPLVYLVNLLYKIVIPFMLVGLGLQVLLHLYRVALRR
jgi:hypothetical protein